MEPPVRASSMGFTNTARAKRSGSRRSASATTWPPSECARTKGRSIPRCFIQASSVSAKCRNAQGSPRTIAAAEARQSGRVDAEVTRELECQRQHVRLEDSSPWTSTMSLRTLGVQCDARMQTDAGHLRPRAAPRRRKASGSSADASAGRAPSTPRRASLAVAPRASFPQRGRRKREAGSDRTTPWGPATERCELRASRRPGASRWVPGARAGRPNRG
jgi:hypothetical protein